MGDADDEEASAEERALFPPLAISASDAESTPGGGSACGNKRSGDGTTSSAPEPAITGAPPLLYELYAVLVHSGSASFGHYYALIKDLEHGEWYEFNDSSVTPIKESELQRAWGSAASTSSWASSSSAYMLLYRRKSADGEAEASRTADAEKAAAGAVSGVADYVSTHASGADANGEPAKGADFKRVRLTPPYGAAEGSASVDPMALSATADLNA